MGKLQAENQRVVILQEECQKQLERLTYETSEQERLKLDSSRKVTDLTTKSNDQQALI